MRWRPTAAPRAPCRRVSCARVLWSSLAPARGEGVGGAEAGSSGDGPCRAPPRGFGRAVPIDVVMWRSPGPGLSCARRGTDVHGERGRSSRSAHGPLASPPRLSAVCGRQGCGIRPDLAPPPSVSRRRWGRGLCDAVGCSSSSPPGCVSLGRPSPWWGGPCRHRAACLLGAWASALRSSVVPLERSGSPLSCLRPSGAVVSRLQRLPRVTAVVVCPWSQGAESVREACPSSLGGGRVPGRPTACRLGP